MRGLKRMVLAAAAVLAAAGSSQAGEAEAPEGFAGLAALAARDERPPDAWTFLFASAPQARGARAPMVERSTPRAQLESLPHSARLVEWAEDGGVGLRRLRLARKPRLKGEEADTHASPPPTPGTEIFALLNAEIAARAKDPHRVMTADGIESYLRQPAALRTRFLGRTNNLRYFCTALVCTPGARAGETIIETSQGPVVHVYDDNKPIGQRNAYSFVDAAGNVMVNSSSPLAFDLSGKGLRTSDQKHRYDIDGDGSLEVIHDLSSGSGLLAFDADGDGVSGEHGRELFGENTDLDGDGRPDGFRDGFEALWGLVRKAVAQGRLPARVLDEKSLGPGRLAALERAYGLRMRVGGFQKKAMGLQDAGVVSISLSEAPTRLVGDFDGQGNHVMRRDGATFVRKDGGVGSYEDVWFSSPRASRPSPLLAAK